MVQPTVPFRTIYTSCQYSTSCLDIKFGEQKAEQIMKSNYSGNTKSVNRKQMIDCSLMDASKFFSTSNWLWNYCFAFLSGSNSAAAFHSWIRTKWRPTVGSCLCEHVIDDELKFAPHHLAIMGQHITWRGGSPSIPMTPTMCSNLSASISVREGVLLHARKCDSFSLPPSLELIYGSRDGIIARRK